MTWWIIKHVPSGGHLPAAKGREGRGFTHQEVASADGPLPPRLFHTEASAKSALNWWLRGITRVSITEDYFGEIDEEWTITEQPHRIAEDMKIVKVRIEPYD